jgi:hypothetical protein
MARRFTSARCLPYLLSVAGATRRAATPRAKGALFGAVIALALTPTDGNSPTWVQICAENTYKGHPAAKKLAWDRAFFESVVANFRAHPWYKAGTNGVGAEPVVPFDFEHASEMAPTDGSIPQQGAPAAGWVLELSIRDAEDGSAELWALSDFRPDVREQIRAGGYRSTSVAIAPNSVDPVSGAKTGPVLTSVALTNHPFVQGMEPIAASLEQYGPAETTEEALVGLRRIFELVADSDPSLIVKQIQTLRAAIAGGTVPESIDLKYLLEQIRRLLSLGLMATTDEILGGAESAANGSAPSQSDQSTQLETSMPGLATALAAILKCTEDDKAIITAASKASEKATEAAAAEQVTDALSKLKQMFGSSDMQDLIAKATKTIADAEALKPTLEALAAAQAALKSGAEQDAEAEAAAVAASLARGDQVLAKRLLPGVLASRTACINKDGSIDAPKLEQFRKDFPLEEAQRALLIQRIVAGPNGQQLGGAVTGYRTEPITASAGAPASQVNPPELDKLVSELNAQPGRNPLEKTNALLCSRSAAHKALPWAEQVRAADAVQQQILAGRLPTIPA